MTTDWKSLAKETVHSFDADEGRGMWDVDWQRARSVFLADHEAEIAAEPRRWKKVLRKTNAIVFGLAKRLAPPRRLVFAFVLLLTLLAFVESFGGDSWSGQASWAFFALFVSVLALAVLFGDASGHGMAAGLVMAVTHAGFRTQLPVDPSPCAMIQSLHRVLCETGNARSFFAGGYALLEPGGAVTAYVAGHPPVLKLDAEGRIVARLGAGSYPLGIKKNATYTPVSTTLTTGEMLLFHSDGLPEARGPSGEEFGDARIEHVLFRKAGAQPYEVVFALAAELDRFLGRAVADDDVSIVAIRRKTA